MTIKKLHAAILLAASAAAAACDAAPPEASESTLALAASADARPVDAPGTPAILLRWKTARDGAKAVAALDFEVENTTGQAIDVELHAATRSSGDPVERSAGRLSVAAKSRVAHGLPVEQLGLQLVGSSANTLIVATYAGPDGLTRSTPLNPVWVEHVAGFKSARVRSDEVEARNNARAGLARLRTRRPTEARMFDANSRAFAGLAVSSDRIGAGGLVTQLPGLPTPAEFQAPKNPAQNAEIADAEKPDSGNKGGFFQVCFRIPYFFADSRLGDDYLNGQTASSVGWEPARYMFAIVATPAGEVGFAGYLGASGCTHFINHLNGSYVAFLTTSIYREASDVSIDVTANSNKEFIFASATYNVSTSGGTITVDPVGYASLQQIDVAVAAANSLYRSTDAYPSGTYTNIFTDVNCLIKNPITGLMEETGCTQGNDISLGLNKTGTPFGYYKVVTQHELGHRVAQALYGTLSNDYVNSASEQLCQCGHVTSSNAIHCLQGRHPIWAAQLEGWGQFFAATNLNVGSEGDCVFPYYKEFRESPTLVLPPPVVKSCFSQVKWRQNKCGSGSSQGVEWDWMNFFWRLDKKDNYSFADFRSVFRQACGGTDCSSATLGWTQLGGAANGVFGAGSVKSNAWWNQGTAFGIAN